MTDIKHEDDSEDKFIESKAEDGHFLREIITKQRIVTIPLTQEIKSGMNYTKTEYQLRALKEGDIVNILIGNYGGVVDGLTHLISALRDCKAKQINCKVVQNSYSCASLLALCGTSLILMPDTLLMFHNYSTVERGKGAEFILSVKEHEKNIRKMFRRICSPFLTENEVEAIEQDKDVYIHWDDRNLKTRIKRHFKGK